MEAKPQLGRAHNQMGYRTHAQYIDGQGRRVTACFCEGVCGRQRALPVGEIRGFPEKGRKDIVFGKDIEEWGKGLDPGPGT